MDAFVGSTPRSNPVEGAQSVAFGYHQMALWSGMKADAVSKKFRLGDIASRRDPRRAPWGYYVCDDNTVGIGLFLWFNTKDGMLQFLAENEGADSDCHDQELLRPAMRKIANRINAGRLGLEKGRQRFNALLAGHVNIEWLGRFDELLSAKHPFCSKIRAELEGNESSIPATNTAQVKEFIDLLSAYGH